MCTIIILHNVHDRYPLIVAANRDEAYDRSAEEPDMIQIMPKMIVAPKDLRSGGTWIGAAQEGWFVGLTNQDVIDAPKARRSRGEIVRELLLLGNHRLATRHLVQLNQGDYAPFNVVFGRPGALFLCRVNHVEPIDVEVIPSGITIVTNDCSDRSYGARESTALSGASLVDHNDDDDAIVNKLEKTLSTHYTGDHLQSLCIHDDVNCYGTRSSSVILVSQNGSVDYYHGEGHPCVSAGVSLRHYLPPLVERLPDDEVEFLFDEDVESIR